MAKVIQLIREIGMQRLLQDIIDELEEMTEEEVRNNYIVQLKVDLENALNNYKKRHEDENGGT